MNLSTLVFFIFSITIGVGLGLLSFYWWTRKKSDRSVKSFESTVLLESIEKVFKVVMAEGYFTEIYNYQNDKNFWNLINDKKKALVIARAKVLVGYDFAKLRFQLSDQDKKITIEYFPEPEVLSIDTDYKFYDIEQGWLNKFHTDDYTVILNEAKRIMNEKALESDLPRIATNQVHLMMFQLAKTMNWKIDLQLPETNKRELDEFTKYRPTDASVGTIGNT